jgi:hypothetical protein
MADPLVMKMRMEREKYILSRGWKIITDERDAAHGSSAAIGHRWYVDFHRRGPPRNASGTPVRGVPVTAETINPITRAVVVDSFVKYPCLDAAGRACEYLVAEKPDEKRGGRVQVMIFFRQGEAVVEEANKCREDLKAMAEKAEGVRRTPEAKVTPEAQLYAALVSDPSDTAYHCWFSGCQKQIASTDDIQSCPVCTLGKWCSITCLKYSTRDHPLVCNPKRFTEFVIGQAKKKRPDDPWIIGAEAACRLMAAVATEPESVSVPVSSSSSSSSSPTPAAIPHWKTAAATAAVDEAASMLSSLSISTSSSTDVPPPPVRSD